MFPPGAFVEAVKPDGPHLWRPARVVTPQPPHYLVCFTGDRAQYAVPIDFVRERAIPVAPRHEEPAKVIVDLTLNDSSDEQPEWSAPIAKPVRSHIHFDPYLTDSPPHGTQYHSHFDHFLPLSPTRPPTDDRYVIRDRRGRMPSWLSAQKMNDHARQYVPPQLHPIYLMPDAVPPSYKSADYTGNYVHGAPYDGPQSIRIHNYHDEMWSSSGADDKYMQRSQESSDDVSPRAREAREKIAREQEKLGVDAVLARFVIPRVPRKHLADPDNRYQQRWRQSTRHGHMTLGGSSGKTPSAHVESECTATSSEESAVKTLSARKKRVTPSKRRRERRTGEPRKKRYTEEIVASGTTLVPLTRRNLRRNANRVQENGQENRIPTANEISDLRVLSTKYASKTLGNGKRKGTTPKKHAGRKPMKILFEVDRSIRSQQREIEENMKNTSVFQSHDGLSITPCTMCSSNLPNVPSGAALDRLICSPCIELVAYGVKHTPRNVVTRWIIPSQTNPLISLRKNNELRSDSPHEKSAGTKPRSKIISVRTKPTTSELDNVERDVEELHAGVVVTSAHVDTLSQLTVV